MYRVFYEKKQSEELENYTAYGLEAYDEADPSHVIKRVGDISLSREKLEQLANQCNEGQLALIHMEDVIEDWLA